MQMNNAEIVKMYREAKDKKAQITILAELNVCDKEDIIKILKAGGVSQAEMPRNRKKTESDGKSKAEADVYQKQPEKEPVAAVTEELPEVVKEVICRQMEQEQEAIDYHSGRLKELNEFLRGKRYE